MLNLEAGHVQDLAPGLRGLIAPNAGAMTHWGTNTFLVGTEDVAVIDPGPADAAHLAAILDAARGASITHIFVTHAHLDHSPLARDLSERTGAPVYGFGGAEDGRRPVMKALGTEGLAGGGEGVDSAFAPDITVGDGEVVESSEWQISVLHTPGHFAGHLAFRFGDHLLSGDHVMDWSSSLVSPPDGDLDAFMTTSRRLHDLDRLTFHPAHGGTIRDPRDRLGWLIAHREKREAAILNALSPQPQSIPDLTRAVCIDIPPGMMPAAERNVFAHLIALVERSLVSATPKLAVQARYSRL